MSQERRDKYLNKRASNFIEKLLPSIFQGSAPNAPLLSTNHGRELAKIRKSLKNDSPQLMSELLAPNGDPTQTKYFSRVFSLLFALVEYCES